MTFRPLTDPVDYIVLAGLRSPGIATIEGAETPRNFDERRGFGVSFASLRFRGVSLARFKVLLRLYTEKHWDDWHEWKSIVARPSSESNPRRGPIQRLTAPPMEIEHPILSDLGITSVVVENVVQPTQTDDGEWTIEIRCIEYRAPVIALETTEGAADRTENDNVERQIAANSRLIEQLSNPRGLAGA